MKKGPKTDQAEAGCSKDGDGGGGKEVMVM